MAHLGKPPFESSVGLDVWMATRNQPLAEFTREKWDAIGRGNNAQEATFQQDSSRQVTPQQGTYKLGHGCDPQFDDAPLVTPSSESSYNSSNRTGVSGATDYLGYGRPRADSGTSSLRSWKQVPFGAPAAPRSLITSTSLAQAPGPVRDPFHAIKPINASDECNRPLGLDDGLVAGPSLDNTLYGAIGGSANGVTLQSEDGDFMQGREVAMPAEASAANNAGKIKPQQHARRSGNRDEFDGAVQTLPLPGMDVIMAMDQKATSGRVSLEPIVQAHVMKLLTTCLSKSAFDWVSRYQFPIPRAADKPPVTCPEDRTWNEWAFLLKRLATKRRIPARLLKDSHIKAFVPTMENSTIVPQPSNGAVVMMEDRYLLQVISAGIQVTRLIQDGHSTYYLLNLYNEVSNLISKGLVSTYVNSQKADDSCAVQRPTQNQSF